MGERVTVREARLELPRSLRLDGVASSRVEIATLVVALSPNMAWLDGALPRRAEARGITVRGAARARLAVAWRDEEGGLALDVEDADGEAWPVSVAHLRAVWDPGPHSTRPWPRLVEATEVRAWGLGGLRARARPAGASGWRIDVEGPGITTTSLVEDGRLAGTAAFAEAPLAGLELPWLRTRGIDVEQARATGVVSFRLTPLDAQVDGRLDAAPLGLDNPAIAARAVRGLALATSGGVRWSRSAEGVRSDGLELRLNGVPFALAGHAGSDGVEATLRMGRLPCQRVLDAARPFVPTLDGLELAGELGAEVTLRIDGRRIQDLRLDVDIDDGCAVARDAPRADVQAVAGALPVRLESDADDLLAPALLLAPDSHDFRPIDTLRDAFVRPFVVAEDARFLEHHGFDPWMIRRALAADLQAGELSRGASTITQQVARNLYLGNERSLSRKLEEAVIAWRLEQVVPKRRLLELYLNLVELAPGVRGVGAGARYWFGKDVDVLTTDETALLASLLPAPRRGLDDAWSRRYRDLLVKLRALDALDTRPAR